MFGGGTGTMTLDELLVLEKHLELWIYNIRSTKVSLIFFFFGSLRMFLLLLLIYNANEPMD